MLLSAIGPPPFDVPMIAVYLVKLNNGFRKKWIQSVIIEIDKRREQIWDCLKT